MTFSRNFVKCTSVVVTREASRKLTDARYVGTGRHRSGQAAPPTREIVASTSERWLPGGRACILDLMNEVTQILSAIERGDSKATEELLPVVYGELRKLAAAKLKEEQPGQTLQPTALVHEAYLRLVGSGEPTGWDGRGHFFAAAAEAMRRILIDNARRKKRIRHGGDLERRSLLENDAIVRPPR